MGSLILGKMLLSHSALASNQPPKHPRLLVREYPRLAGLAILDQYPPFVPGGYAKRADR